MVGRRRHHRAPRVGVRLQVRGRDVAEGAFHDGLVSRYEATYTDIVEHNRIVTT